MLCVSFLPVCVAATVSSNRVPVVDLIEEDGGSRKIKGIVSEAGRGGR